MKTISIFYIFANNQAAIITIRDLEIKSGQALIKAIVQILNYIRLSRVTVIIHQIPAYSSYEGNERADVAAKRVTGLKTLRREGKIIERDSNNIAPRFDLGVYIIAPLKFKMRPKVDKRQLDKQKKKIKGKALKKVTPTLLKEIIRIHRGLYREANSVLTQIRTEKIGLRAYLFDRHVSGIDNVRYEYRSRRWTARYIIEEYRYHRVARERHWLKELTDKKVGILTTNKMLIDYPQKAVEFIQKTGFIRYWDQNRGKIKG